MDYAYLLEDSRERCIQQLMAQGLAVQALDAAQRLHQPQGILHDGFMERSRLQPQAHD